MAVYLRDGLQCSYCPATIVDAPFTLDHIRDDRSFQPNPRYPAGNNPQFVVSACLSCNSRRQRTPWGKFVPKQSDRRRILRRATKPLGPYQDTAQVLLKAPGGPPPWWVAQRDLARRRAKGSEADEAMARVLEREPGEENPDPDETRSDDTDRNSEDYL